MMGTVYKWKRMQVPNDPGLCVQKLARAESTGRLIGLAFIALLDGQSYVAETCGEASADLEQTRILLKAFDAKLAKRQIGGQS